MNIKRVFDGIERCFIGTQNFDTHTEQDGLMVNSTVEVVTHKSFFKIIIGGTPKDPNAMLNAVEAIIDKKFDKDDGFYLKHSANAFIAEVVEGEQDAYSYEETLQELEKFIKAAYNKATTLANYDSLEMTCEKQKEKIDGLLETEAALKADFAELQASYDQLKSEASPDVIDAAKAKIQELETNVKTAQDKITYLETQLATAENIVSKLKEENNELEEALEAAKTEATKKASPKPAAKPTQKPAAKKSDTSEGPKAKKDPSEKLEAIKLGAGKVKKPERTPIPEIEPIEELIEEETSTSEPEKAKKVEPVTSCSDAINAIFG